MVQFNQLVRIVVVGRSEGGSLHLSSFGSRNLDGLAAAISVNLDDVLDGFAISEGAESFGLNGSLVDKDISGTIIRDNESEALHGVEPLDGTLLNTIGGNIGGEETEIETLGDGGSTSNTGRKSGNPCR
jgi:hypothetical protein